MATISAVPQQITPAASHLERITQAVSNRDLLKWMFQFVKPVKHMMALTGAYLALLVGAEILTVRQTARAVDQIKALHLGDASTQYGFWHWISSSSWDAIALRNTILLLAIFAGAMGLLRYLREVSNSKLSMRMVFYIRQAVYDKLQRVGFSFHDAVSTGQLISRALTDLQNVRMFVQSAVLTSLEIVLIVGGYIVLILTRSPWVALLALVPMPFWTWYILRFSKKAQPSWKAVLEADDRNVSILTENIAGVHVVKAFATEKQEVDKYNKNADTFYQRTIARIRLFANFQPIIRAIASASNLTLFLAAGILMIKQKLNVGDFLILGAAMGSILGRLQQVSVINDQYQAAVVSAKRLYEVLMAPPTVPEKPNAPALPAGGGAVRFEDVSFGYDPNRPVLRNISFEVKAGSAVAIVGPTGSGKTTLVNLISRFYDPQAGRILVDGMDLRDCKLASIRSQVAFVFQETYLFSDSVAANIAYGREYLRGGEIEAASRLAQAHEFIEGLPRGYDTILGERGASLSGGQRQRLAIARAILSNPRILVLDDATAAVDPETEDLIRRGMGLVMRGRTTFVIAHRISTVKRADLVIVLEDGRITQLGTHEQLMRQHGHYREIAAVQLYGDSGPPRLPEDPPSHMDRLQDTQRLAVTASAAQGGGDGSESRI